MPLEQIRPAVALEPEQIRHRPSIHDYDASSPPSPNDEDVEWPGNVKFGRSAQEMNLTKLGGVGGVTRSGSWGRNGVGFVGGSSSQLVRSPNFMSDDEDLEVKEGGKSGLPFPEDGPIYGSGSSGVPSSSSRTSTSTSASTSSSSAAAFSLRSLSNRNSTGSVSSSASSSRSRLANCSGEDLASSSSIAGVYRSAESDAATIGLEGSSRDSQSDLASVSTTNGMEMKRSSSGSPMEDEKTRTTPDLSAIAPSVFGLRSISQGASPTISAGLQLHEDLVTQDLDVVGGGDGWEATNLRSTKGKGRELLCQLQDPISCPAPPTADRSDQGGLLGEASIQGLAWQGSAGGEARAPNSIVALSGGALSPPQGRKETSAGGGTGKEGSGLDRSPQLCKPSSLPPATGISNLTSLGGLSLHTTAESFKPALPRKHSGFFMLRSRSQMSSHPTILSQFSGAGGGRAAARDRARHPSGYENAPFSVLEARRHAQLGVACSQPASPGLYAMPFSWDELPSSSRVSSAATLSASALDLQDEALARSLTYAKVPSLTPLSMTQLDVAQTTTPAAADRAQGHNGPEAGIPSGLGGTRWTTRPTPTAIDPSRVALLPGFDEAKVSMSPSASAEAQDRAALGVARGHPQRPSMSRSPSLVGANVLRTPTTEEWSRFLESQGVNASGRHSRSGTGLSSGSAAGLSSRLGITSMRSAIGSNADSDSDSLEEDSDEDPIDQAVIERLKQIGCLGRAATAATSRAGSVIGEDLESLHEEDEPASPQDDQTRRLVVPASAPSLLPVPTNTPPLPLSPSEAGETVVVTTTGLRASSPLSSPNRGRSPAIPPGSVAGEGVGADLSGLRSPPRSKRTSRESSSVPLVGGYPSGPSRGQRSISDFEVVADIGRGAYGLVKKAKLRGPDGRGSGDEFIIKYIIKSRILADCWRRHKVLGPIPIEIHVMDQLRRLPYNPPTEPLPWSPDRPRTKLSQQQQKSNSTPVLESGKKLSPAPDSTPTSNPIPLAKDDTPTQGGQQPPPQTSHPNLCKMVDFFEDHEFYYMVMPCFGTGQDLFDYVESAPDGLEIFQVRSLLGQVADAVRFLHANNIVHRDIKDENVILDGKGNAQLIDFGSAAHVRQGRLFDTFSGTLDYAAAEILRGEKYAGQAQDIWALGVVGYVLLLGECPFWNGEEAIGGLAQGSRAAQSLKERCDLARQMRVSSEEEEGEGEEESDASLRDEAEAEADGGGALEDAADLISRCLEVDPNARPTAEMVCQHKFLKGFGGWLGPKGWERRTEEVSTPKGEQELVQSGLVPI
ncbi:Pkinase-domain-containing protein [Violaceomyces palustris]|uniref:Pkinase-domain-containing protein n=1 Tax=Violaceomyces palustris TaxID=1673888 RepID=A0ACD0NWK8_9BASI|nr:Pkinase-domain-containing protein [Violaceomyces palustris]